MSLQSEIQSAIDEVLTELAALKAHRRYDDVLPTPGRPAPGMSIRALEQRIGLLLPPSYKAFLQMHDGYAWLAWPGHMLSIRDASPGGEYWDDIAEWKRETAEAGYGAVLDGVVIAYLEQPNNWVYLDPNRIASTGEWDVVLHVPGTDPTIYPDIAALLRGCASNARLSLQWASQK